MAENRFNRNTKVIIISDIKNEEESIIPYGLQLAKRIESEVDIIHIIDKRDNTGVSSSYADSQSITPGKKLSHDTIMLKEKNEIESALDHLLSREGSRLNYPLKINTVVEEGNIEATLKEKIEKNLNSIILMNENTDHQIFTSQHEMVKLVEKTEAYSLIIPPGFEFKSFETIVLSTDFSNKDFENYADLFYFLNKFNPLITAVDVHKDNNYATKELESKAWLNAGKNIIPELNLKTNILHGKDYIPVLQNYLKLNKPDLLILFKRKQNVLEKFLSSNPEKEIIQKSDRPVLYYP